MINSKGHKTILEKRTTKGIWQNLYQFPLIETSKTELNKNFIANLDHKILKKLSIKSIELFNKKEIIHRLSHQELYIKFWIIHTSDDLKQGIVWSEVSKRAVPIVIDRFIREFQS